MASIIVVLNKFTVWDQRHNVTFCHVWKPQTYSLAPRDKVFLRPNGRDIEDRESRDFARKQEGFPKENLQTPSLIWPRRNFFSSYLPSPLGKRPEITRVLQLLLQLSEPLPCFLKTLSRANPSNPRTSGPEPAPSTQVPQRLNPQVRR